MDEFDDNELGNYSYVEEQDIIIHDKTSVMPSSRSDISLSSNSSSNADSSSFDDNSSENSDSNTPASQSSYHSSETSSEEEEEEEMKSSLSVDTMDSKLFDDITISGWSHKSAETQQDTTATDEDSNGGWEHVSISGIICVTLTLVLVVVVCIVSWQKADEWFPFLFQRETIFKTPTSRPTIYSSMAPTWSPTEVVSLHPTLNPTEVYSLTPSSNPTLNPTEKPSINPTEFPTSYPSMHPTSLDDILLGIKSWDQVGGDIFNLKEFHKGFSRKSVSFSDDDSCLAIGHDGYNDFRGYVRVFSLSTYSKKWEQIGNTLYSDSMDIFQKYGDSIAISNSCQLIVIGAPGTGLTAGTDDGKVYIYYLKNGFWYLALKLESDTYKRLGASVDLVEQSDIIYIAIGASPYLRSSLGSVVVYQYFPETKSLIQVGNHILEETAGSKFGESISMCGNGTMIVVGASTATNSKGDTVAGYAEVYEFRGNTWILKGQRLEGTQKGQEFGLNVLLSEDASLLIVGSEFSIHSFKYINDTWHEYGQSIYGRIPSLSSDGNLLAIKVGNSLSKLWVNVEYGWEAINVHVSNESSQENIALSGNGNYVAISYSATNVIDETGVVKVYKIPQ
jgi:hypothetical protein